MSAIQSRHCTHNATCSGMGSNAACNCMGRCNMAACSIWLSCPLQRRSASNRTMQARKHSSRLFVLTACHPTGRHGMALDEHMRNQCDAVRCWVLGVGGKAADVASKRGSKRKPFSAETSVGSPRRFRAASFAGRLRLQSLRKRSSSQTFRRPGLVASHPGTDMTRVFEN